MSHSLGICEICSVVSRLEAQVHSRPRAATGQLTQPWAEIPAPTDSAASCPRGVIGELALGAGRAACQVGLSRQHC